MEHEFLLMLGKVSGVIVTVVSFIATLIFFILNFNYKKAEKLEKHKYLLQKELGEEKEKHLNQMVEVVKQETFKLSEKVDNIKELYLKIDFEMRSNQKQIDKILNTINDLMAETQQKFRVLENEQIDLNNRLDKVQECVYNKVKHG